MGHWRQMGIDTCARTIVPGTAVVLMPSVEHRNQALVICSDCLERFLRSVPCPCGGDDHSECVNIVQPAALALAIEGVSCGGEPAGGRPPAPPEMN